MKRRKRNYMIAIVVGGLLASSAMGAPAHRDKNHGRPKVVSAAVARAADTSAHQEQVEGIHDEHARVPAGQATERDFETIRAEVQDSTVFIVIKALALAIAIAGMAFVYLPKKSREGRT